MLKFNVGRVTILPGVATQVVPARPGRKMLRVNVTGSSVLNIGPDDTVTTSTGFEVNPISLDNMEDPVYAIYSGSPTSRVAQFLEIYDDGM